eukprot:487450_1
MTLASLQLNNYNTCMHTTLFIITYCISVVSAIFDLDTDGYPTTFSVEAYASDGVYSFNGKWYNGRRVYEHEDTEREIWWNPWQPNSWLISWSAGGGYYAQCTNSILHECTQNIIVKYCVYAEKSNGYYKYNETKNGNAVFVRDWAWPNDRYMHYITDPNKWVISRYSQTNESETNPVYSECNNHTNVFECNDNIIWNAICEIKTIHTCGGNAL